MLPIPVADPAENPVPASTDRIISLDQFRGYTVAGMFLVNFVGGYAACPAIIKHHNDYCSYADTIMPHFLFVVGFAYRLTFERRVQRDGARAAYGRVIRRLLGLILLSVVIYTPSAPAATWEALRSLSLWEIIGPPLKRDWFQTLMHIAVTSLWITPVIRATVRVRIGWLLLSAALHVGLSWWFNFAWCNTSPNAIDGGPLGFLTWSVPALLGTLTCDAFTSSPGRPPLLRLAAGALLLMGLGWLLSCGTRLYDVDATSTSAPSGQKLADDPVWPGEERLDGRPLRTLIAEPPFVLPPGREVRQWNYWMMSQRAGTLSYQTFAAGLSLLVYVVFYVACDVMRLQLGLFRTLGTNALAGYILHMWVDAAVSPFVPGDAPAWYMWTGFAVYFGITWLFIRSLERNNIYLRL